MVKVSYLRHKDDECERTSIHPQSNKVFVGVGSLKVLLWIWRKEKYGCSTLNLNLEFTGKFILPNIYKHLWGAYTHLNILFLSFRGSDRSHEAEADSGYPPDILSHAKEG